MTARRLTPSKTPAPLTFGPPAGEPSGTPVTPQPGAAAPAVIVPTAEDILAARQAAATEADPTAAVPTIDPVARMVAGILEEASGQPAGTYQVEQETSADDPIATAEAFAAGPTSEDVADMDLRAMVTLLLNRTTLLINAVKIVGEQQQYMTDRFGATLDQFEGLMATTGGNPLKMLGALMGAGKGRTNG